MELLESLNNLQPAGAGRADTKARELRREAEQLRRALAEAEVRSGDVCRRALHSGPIGEGERRLSVELSRFQLELLKHPQHQQQEEPSPPSTVANESVLELQADEPILMPQSQSPSQREPSKSRVDETMERCSQEHELLEALSPESTIVDRVSSLPPGADPWKSPSRVVATVQTFVAPTPLAPLFRDTIAVAPQTVVERAAYHPSAPHALQKNADNYETRPTQTKVPLLSLQADSQANNMKFVPGARKEKQYPKAAVKPTASPARAQQRSAVSPKGHARRTVAPQRKLPTDSAIRQAFIAIDRSWSGRLTQETFMNGIGRKELRSVLAHGFGTPFLTQPATDLLEDLEFIFDRITENLEVVRQPSAPEFVFNLLQLMKELQPLQPETPRLHPGTKMRWTRLIRSWRRKLADTSIRLPLLALQRLVKRVEAAEDFAELPAELSSQAVLVDSCDWQTIPPGYLLEACSDMARVATALPRFTACDKVAFVDLVKATQRLRSVVLSRLREFSPQELVGITLALFPAPLNDTPLEQRTFLTIITAQVHVFSMGELAALARMFDGMGGYDCDFFIEAARCIYERTASGLRSLAIVAPADVAALLWLLARYRHSRSGGEHPLEVLSTARILCSALVGFVATLCEADLARLLWGLGHLNERPAVLVAELGDQVAWRSRRSSFSAREYSRIVWGLAVLGVRPWNAEEIATNAAHAAAQADAERNPLAHAEQMPFLEAPELAQLASALGAWAVNDTANLQPLWALLRRRLADFTGEELLMAVAATLSLGIRDDVLMITAQARALVVGPFDPEGAGDFLRCLQNYAHRFCSEQVRDLAAGYAIQAFRHTNVPLTNWELSQCIGPSTISAKGT